VAEETASTSTVIGRHPATSFCAAISTRVIAKTTPTAANFRQVRKRITTALPQNPTETFARNPTPK
jgi:hypothetical protein